MTRKKKSKQHSDPTQNKRHPPERWATLGDRMPEALREASRPKSAKGRVEHLSGKQSPPPRHSGSTQGRKEQPEHWATLGDQMSQSLRDAARPKTAKNRSTHFSDSQSSTSTQTHESKSQSVTSKPNANRPAGAKHPENKRIDPVPGLKKAASGSKAPEGERPIVKKPPPAPYRTYGFPERGGTASAKARTGADRPKILRDPALIKRLSVIAASANQTGSVGTTYRRKMESFLAGQRESTRGRLPVNLGLDLGTGFTKVVWRDLRLERSRPVTFFPHLRGLDAVLLPSVIMADRESVTCGGNALVTARKSGRVGIEHFKMCLACVGSAVDPCTPEACQLTDWRQAIESGSYGSLPVETLTAYFLAQVIAESKQRVRAELRKSGVLTPIHWSANLAVPAKHLDQNSVGTTFEIVLKAAWVMAAVVDGIGSTLSPEAVQECFAEALNFAVATDLDCFTYAEVGAQVASATLARSARDGLYGFVDVGAGTVDAAIFRLNSLKGEPEINTYDAEVVRMGVAYLRSKALKADPMLKENHFPDALERSFSGELEDALVPLLKRAWAKENNGRAWRTLNLIIGGGGSNIPLYRTVAQRLFGKCAASIELVPLPVPADFERGSIHASDFHRLAVAYGLSHERVALGDVALPNEVKPLERYPARTKKVEMVSKDMV